MTSMLNVERIRAQFPAMRRMYKGMRVAYFDGPGGSQVVQSAIDAMTLYMTRGGANLHGAFPSSVETESIIADAKYAMAAMLGAKVHEIAFGANMTTLALSISRALARGWQEGDEVVVTELDHRANVDPWRLAAQDRGVTVKWLRVNPDTLTLNLSTLNEVITEKTKLVAVGLSSNAVGTVTDVARIARRAHECGAVMAVDAVHAAPHIAIDRDLIDADILLCSAYKFFGPHIGIGAIREDLFERLDVYKLAPAPSNVPDKLETGTQNHEGIAGVLGAVNFISTLGKGTTLRERIVDAMNGVEAHESPLAFRLRQGLRDIDGVTVYSGPDEVRKTPTVAFTLAGYTPREVSEQLVETYGIFVADGDFYASTLAAKLGLAQCGGWVRAGLAPYNTEAEVEALIDAVARLARA